jgi:uncharacterized protein (TIGR00369 family)
MEKRLPYYHGCFGCGRDNPCGVALEFTVQGEKVTATYNPKDVHVGFKGVVHGGVVTTLLDEAMWWAIAAEHKQNTFTAQITVEFKRPVEHHKSYIVEGSVVEERKGRIFRAQGQVVDNQGNLYAMGLGTFIKAPKEAMTTLLEGLSDTSLFASG